MEGETTRGRNDSGRNDSGRTGKWAKRPFTLKMSYGYSRVGLSVARNVVRNFVVDRRSTTVIGGSAAVLSRPHCGV